MDQKQIVKDFLKDRKHMIIATESNGIPEAALVGFASFDNLNLIFGTSIQSRKFQNIQNNSRVAIVFTDDEKATVQYEGVVSILIGNELAEYKEVYFKKNPSAKQFESDPNQVYLKVVPIWLRYTEVKSGEREVFEIRF